MSLGRKLQHFLRSPQGQKAVHKVKRELAKPHNQHKLKRLIAKLSGRRYR